MVDRTPRRAEEAEGGMGAEVPSLSAFNSRMPPCVAPSQVGGISLFAFSCIVNFSGDQTRRAGRMVPIHVGIVAPSEEVVPSFPTATRPERRREKINGRKREPLIILLMATDTPR